MVSVRNLTKVFGGRRQVVAVEDASFEVRDGEFVTLLGPSGCGKTTTLRCIAGLERPTGGTISIGGCVVASASDGIFVPPEKRGLGMVFQSYAVWPHMTVFENVIFPLEAKRVPRAQASERVARALETVDLIGLEQRYPTQLSGGQQQRVALARAIIGEPRALLFDEPLSNLDAKLRERMRLELMDLQRRIGCTAIYVTHDQAEAMVMSDRIIVMNAGKIQQVGSPRDVYEEPANEFVADFIGVANFVPGTILGPREDGTLQVASALGDIRIARGDGQPDAPVLVSIRPEWIKIATTPMDFPINVWRGVIEHAVYLGQNCEYVIRVDGLRFRAQTDAGRLLAKGSSIYMYLAPERCVLVRRQS